MSATRGSFSFGDTTVHMPVKSGTLGPAAVDLGKFYAQTGMFTYDPGFTSTASCESEITYIDGEKGLLLYRGYPIEQLAEHGFPRDLLSFALWAIAHCCSEEGF